MTYITWLFFLFLFLSGIATAVLLRYLSAPGRFGKGLGQYVSQWGRRTDGKAGAVEAEGRQSKSGGKS